MARVRVLILRAAGTNCDLETQHAWELAGAQPERVHIRRLAESASLLGEYQILTIPGGFSYGDDIAAGRIFAAQVQRWLGDELNAFVSAGKLILGICNGLQVLVQAGLLPFRKVGVERAASALQGRAEVEAGRTSDRTCTVAANEPPGFQDRWVYLRAPVERCVFVERGRIYEMPIAHGEGRVTFASAADLAAVERDGQNALLYTPPPAGQPNLHGEPCNPNGSQGDIAGLCDESGRVLGLMPHPERFVTWTQHPCWTSLPPRTEGDGLALFRRALGCFQ
ncbi:MAG: phosphoribosylformylglycinamidine synthase subunit PurQ [Planctomycetota bacterium]